MEIHAEVAEQYADFVGYACDDSPCLAAWAGAVVEDPEVLAWLATLPPGKQQPNLVFAAARWHGTAAPGPYAALREALLGDDGAIRHTIMTRSTQTNEVGRLATLTPALARWGESEPVALLEVGASAGLCLYPDQYDYEWRTGSGPVTSRRGKPLLTCEVTGPFPSSVAPPVVGWRGGVDLNPLDVHDDEAMAWLTTLVWPEQDERRERLATAVAIARRDPPHLETGNLLEEVPRLVEEASAHGPVVVFHSAVVAYLEDRDRDLFQQMMLTLVAAGRCHWLSNEGKRVLPAVTATGPEVPADLQTFVLGADGLAVAWTHGHGRSMTWL